MSCTKCTSATDLFDQMFPGKIPGSNGTRQLQERCHQADVLVQSVDDDVVLWWCFAGAILVQSVHDYLVLLWWCFSGGAMLVQFWCNHYLCMIMWYYSGASVLVI